MAAFHILPTCNPPDEADQADQALKFQDLDVLAFEKAV